jgi:hypothetical protein
MNTQTPSTTHQPASPANDERRPYESPEITSFGDITEVTGETAHAADY